MNACLPTLPTFAEFLDAAREQGCTERTVRGRMVLENPALGLPVVVKVMRREEHLTRFYAEYLCRMLGVKGFTADEVQTFTDWRPSEPEQS